MQTQRYKPTGRGLFPVHRCHTVGGANDIPQAGPHGGHFQLCGTANYIGVIAGQKNDCGTDA